MPFRIGILFTLFNLVCFSVEALIFYSNMQTRVLGQIDNVLAQHYSNLKQVYEEKGIDDVIQTVEISQSASPVESGTAYKLTSPDNEIIAGNVSSFSPQSGFYHVDGEVLGFDSKGPKYRLYTDKLGDNVITIGQSEKLLDDLKKNSIASFLLALAATSIFALFGAMFLANRSQARIKVLSEFTGNVGKGDLSARLPISYRGDDIDKISGNMNDAVSLLQRKVEGMKQVTDNIAHDLKTPLSRLYMRLEEAASMAQAEDPILDKLEAAIKESAQINDTFEALLSISQLEAGVRKSRFVATSLSQLLKTAYDIYDVVVEENEQYITLHLEEDELVVMGDKDLLLRLVVNLIENSIRHCPPHSMITLTGGMKEQKPWIGVYDNGPGIPERERDRVFERLYRLEESRTTDGSGLGLSIVKVIADIHGGTIKLIDNKPGLCASVIFDS